MVYKAGMVEETLEAKLKRHEDALMACMAEITKLREENNRLRATANATAGAHDVLRELYLDPDTPPALRAKCAIGALPHEVPRLMPEKAPLDLTAKEVEYEPLSVIVERQRKRCDQILALPLEERAALITGVGRDGGNSDDH
jgi:hypothetical protein